MEPDYSPLDLETIFAASKIPSGEDADPDPLVRTGHVVFEYKDSYPYGYEVRAFGPVFAGGSDAEPACVGYLEADETWLLGQVQDCLSEWEQYIGKYYDIPGGTFAPDREHIEAAVPALAEAGDRLFSVVFLQGDAGLSEIGRMLTDAMRTGEQVITFASDRIFIPWWIMYSDPGPAGNGGNAHWSPAGFWGYRHLLEHEFIRFGTCADHRIPVADEPLRVSLNLDLGLDGGGVPVTEPVLEFFAARGAASAHVIRTTSLELGEALMSPDFGDQLMYFCCHCGAQQSPYGGPSRSVLQLTDTGTFITPAHVSGWLRGRELISNPLIFINACGGGLLSTHFYCSFSHELLRKAANCLLGPGVRVPGPFAAKYAIELLARFLEPHCRLGTAMRDVTRYLMDHCHTPLGLIYGLYRGLDTRLVAGHVG